MNAPVTREHPAVYVDGALPVVVAHRAAAQWVRRDEMSQVEETPGRVGNEVGAQRARMTPQLFVHACEDLLLPGLIPRDADPAVALPGRRLEQDRAARVVLP